MNLKRKHERTITIFLMVIFGTGFLYFLFKGQLSVEQFISLFGYAIAFFAGRIQGGQHEKT